MIVEDGEEENTMLTNKWTIPNSVSNAEVVFEKDKNTHVIYFDTNGKYQQGIYKVLKSLKF